MTNSSLIDITNIGIKGNYALNDRSGASSIAFKQGDVISAFVAEKTNGKATLVTESGFTFKADSSKIKGEQGDTLKFSVEKFDKNGIVLKQLGVFADENQIEAAISEQTAKELFEQSNFTKDINVLDKEYIEEQTKAAEALARIKRQISYASSNLSPNAVAELIAAGMSLQKIDISMLSETIREVKSNSHGESDVDAIEAVKKRISSFGGLNEGSVVRLLKDESPLTADNIYVAKHSGAELKNNNSISSEAWDQLSSEVSKLFEREGIENSEQTDRLWRMMIENDVPVTKENIQKALFLLNLNENMEGVNISNPANNSSDIDLFEVFMALEQDVDQGNEDIDAKIKELFDLLKKITDDHIDMLVQGGKEVTLADFRAFFGEGGLISDVIPVSDNSAIDSTTARRQLAELQLMMTEEAARRLYESGLDIDTMPVRRVIDELKALEAEKYSSALRAAGVDDTVENVSSMDVLYTMMRESRPFTNNVFAMVMANMAEFDIAAVNEAAMTARSTRALSDLETFQTVPNPKYADSFSKVYSQIAPFVTELGIEATSQNVKAAAILSKNEMDVTIDNILTVKEIDMKLADVYNRLHPGIAANMIKDGHNPTKMHIDDVVKYIDKFNDAYGRDLSEKIPDYIAQMDKDKTLTSDEREAMVAVYRMLNSIQKNGGAAIGVAVKNGIDMTLGNMLEASKFFKSTGGRTNKFEFSVDDDFGGLEDVDYKEGSIYGAFAKIEPSRIENYHSAISKRFAESLEPDILKSLLAGSGVWDTPFDELNLILDDMKSEYSETTYTESVRRAGENLNITSEAIKYMVDNNIPLNLANMGIVQNIVKNPHYLAERLDELRETEAGEAVKEAIPDSSLEALSSVEAESQIFANISDALTEAWDTVDEPETLKKINIIQSAIKLQGFTAKTDDLSFKIPINLNGKITGLNMYILNEDAEFDSNASILISIKTARLGEVGVTVSIEGDSVKAVAIGENERSVNYLMQERETLEKFMEDAGFTLSELKFRLKGHGETTQSNIPLARSLASPKTSYEVVI